MAQQTELSDEFVSSMLNDNFEIILRYIIKNDTMKNILVNTIMETKDKSLTHNILHYTDDDFSIIMFPKAWNILKQFFKETKIPIKTCTLTKSLLENNVKNMKNIIIDIVNNNICTQKTMDSIVFCFLLNCQTNNEFNEIIQTLIFDVNMKPDVIRAYISNKEVFYEEGSVQILDTLIENGYIIYDHYQNIDSIFISDAWSFAYGASFQKGDIRDKIMIAWKNTLTNEWNKISKTYMDTIDNSLVKMPTDIINIITKYYVAMCDKCSTLHIDPIFCT